ncbi:MAG: ROK family transcriptional regulator [Planctomycetes bacterium]|nr:ROK family transcriptional regulator [Planctomycetota bacterium]MBL7106009.1 ROK family transcriptional regulator [Phycisphaerae bacterium]
MNKSPIDSKTAGQRNEKLVLNLLKQHKQLSQAQLCKLAGLGSSTASYIVGRLRNKGFILETPGQSKNRGAKPVILSLNPHGRFIIGIEINPNNILIGLFDFNCRLVEDIKIFLGTDNVPEKIVELLEINLLGLIGKHKIDQQKLLGIGVTLSGSVSPDGLVELSSPLGWKNVPLKTMLSSQFNCMIEVHPTRVRLLAEFNITPELSTKNILYLNVANGVGATVFMEGRLIAGSTGRCGELGHIIVDPNGPLCGCGHKGCLEAFISGPALTKKIKTEISEGRQTILANLIKDEDNPEVVINKWGNALKKNDAFALEIRNYVGNFLSKIASAAINCYDPDTLVVAGYVTIPCFEYLANAIKTRFESDLYDDSSRSIEIIPACAGKNALITGVAASVLENSIKNR